MYRLFALVGAVVLVVGMSVSEVGGRLAPTVWTRPVDGPVVRAFDAPRTPYGPGHRGVDFAAPPGTAVRAAGAGIVVFAGQIGPSSHVVVLHPASGWRTGYSFLSSITARRGEAVAGGTVVGTSGGVGDGHDGSVLHFSLRIGDEYVDPMILFRPLDLAQVVHLAPTASDGSGLGFVGRRVPFAAERAGLLAGFAADRTSRPHGLAPAPVGVPAHRFKGWMRLVRWRWF